VHEPEVKLRELEGQAAQVVLDRLEPERKNPLAGADPRDEAKHVVVVDPVVEREDRRSKISANLKDKAINMLLTKDLGSSNDRKVVLQNLTQLARKEKFYEYTHTADAELVEIYSAAVKRTYDLRLATAKNLSMSRTKVLGGNEALTRCASFIRGVQGLPNKYSSWDRESVDSQSDMDVLSFYEGLKLFSLRQVDNCYPRFYYSGLFMRLLFSLFAEKVIYAIMWAVIATRYSLGGYVAGCWNDLPLFGVDYQLNEAKSPAILQRFETHRHCVDNLKFLSVSVAFLILVVVECYFLSTKRASKIEKFFDGLLRCSFHALDAILAVSVLVIHVPVILDVEDLFFPRVKAIDLGAILWCVVMAFHVVWNCVCVFWLKQPHRCFSIFEAIYVARHYDDTCLEDHDMKVFPVQKDFQTVIGDVTCKLKSSIHAYWGIVSIMPTVFSNCSHNEKVSMEGRVGKLLPAHESPEIFKRVLNNWKLLAKSVDTLLTLIPRSEEPMDFYEWAGTFPPTRRMELIRTRVDCHDMPPLHAKSFIKREIALKDECDLGFKDPRFIQGCPLELSAAVGPTLRTWTKQIVHSIGPECFTAAEVRAGKHIIYTCGRSNEEIGQCLRNAIRVIDEMTPGEEIVFLEDDQSRFDLHLLEGPFKFLSNKIYSKKLSRRVAALLKRGVSRGTSSLGTKYSIPFTMQSGWPDTSVGDTLVNAAMKTSIHGSGRPWISIICGDDSVTVTTRGEIERLGGVTGIIESYKGYGMEVEATTCTDPLDIGFCSGRFYPVGDTYVLFPKTARILAKIACDMKMRTRVGDAEAWLRGITATLECYGRVDPLLGALGRSFRGQIGQGREIHDDEWYGARKFDGTVSSTRHDVLMYYDHHYGLSSSQVDALIGQLGVQKFGTLLDSSVLRHMALIDIA
jgi:hypothetical protein